MVSYNVENISKKPKKDKKSGFWNGRAGGFFGRSGMGSLELIAYFWSLNNLAVVKIWNFDFGHLSHPPTNWDKIPTLTENFFWRLPLKIFSKMTIIRMRDNDLGPGQESQTIPAGLKGISWEARARLKPWWKDDDTKGKYIMSDLGSHDPSIWEAVDCKRSRIGRKVRGYLS